MCHGIDYECDNNIQRLFIFENKKYIIIVKVVDEATQAHILKIHNKLSTTQHALKKVNYFLLIVVKKILIFFFKFKD